MQKNHAIIAGITVSVFSFLAGAGLLFLLKRSVDSVIDDELTLLVEQKAANLTLKVRLSSLLWSIWFSLRYAVRNKTMIWLSIPLLHSSPNSSSRLPLRPITRILFAEMSHEE